MCISVYIQSREIKAVPVSYSRVLALVNKERRFPEAVILLFRLNKRSGWQLDLLQVDLLASGGSLLGREKADRATKSREVVLRPGPY